MLRSASRPSSDHVVFVVSSSQPVVGGNVLALFPDKTWERAVTGKNGEAKFDLHALHLSMTVFVAAEGFAAGVERDWVRAERALHVELRPLPGGGAAVFPLGTGFIPGLAGRLNPKLARPTEPAFVPTTFLSTTENSSPYPSLSEKSCA